MHARFRAPVVLLVILFGCSASAQAWGHRRTAVASSYGSFSYYPAPISYYFAPAYPVVISQPAPVAAQPPCLPTTPGIYAVPTPAPAVAAPTPAAPNPAAPTPSTPPAGVKESSSSSFREGRSYYLATASGTVPVAFWNRSNQDLWVRIAGEWRLLPQGRGLTLDLPRAFAWNVQGRETQQERVPAGEPSMRIVIRR